jgi:serine phosphatase RsbU (regulator of sigma subunit)
VSTGGYHQDQVMPGSGDLLVVFTDGMGEAENEAQTEFGKTRSAATPPTVGAWNKP